MDEKRTMLRHFLAALAYRTQKALRGAPADFATFRAGANVRTPHRVVHHMDSVLGYARTFFIGGSYGQRMLASFDEEIDRFHGGVADLAKHLREGTAFQGITPEIMLQGPFSDAMTHAGQLAMLRRLYGDPVPAENFIFAEIDSENLSRHQPLPARPDEGWTPDHP